MFGRNKAAEPQECTPFIPDEATKPVVPALKRWRIVFLNGDELEVNAHRYQDQGGDKAFMEIYDYEWVTPFSFQKEGCWVARRRVVLLASNYLYIKEVE